MFISSTAKQGLVTVIRTGDWMEFFWPKNQNHHRKEIIQVISWPHAKLQQIVLMIDFHEATFFCLGMFQFGGIKSYPEFISHTQFDRTIKCRQNGLRVSSPMKKLNNFWTCAKIHRTNEKKYSLPKNHSEWSSLFNYMGECVCVCVFRIPHQFRLECISTIKYHPAFPNLDKQNCT